MSKPTLKDSLKAGLGGGLKAQITRDNPLNPSLPSPISIQPVRAPVSEKMTKADQYTQRVTLVINTKQRDLVEGIAKTAQRNGLKKPERITANTVLRCMVNLLEGFDGDLSRVTTEEDLNRAFKDFFSQKQ